MAGDHLISGVKAVIGNAIIKDNNPYFTEGQSACSKTDCSTQMP